MTSTTTRPTNMSGSRTGRTRRWCRLAVATWRRIPAWATVPLVVTLSLTGAVVTPSAEAAVPNSPPLAVDDVVSTLSDTAVSIDVLANDTDPDGTYGDGGVATKTAAIRILGAGIRPTVDVPAPESWGADDVPRRGGVAARIELVGNDFGDDSSVWYRLAYVDGGTRLQVFEHYAVGTRGPEADIVASQHTAWQVASDIVGPDLDSTASADLPDWARVNTGNDTGYSAGLIFTLAYLDVLTPGPLVGDLRVAGSGGIGSDGVVTPAFGLETKVAAALLTQPDVVFLTAALPLIDNVTVVESEHTRLPTAGYTVAEWLNLDGYEHVGRVAAAHAGTIALVAVHDLRQALAWLCGRTDNERTCTIAHKAASIPIGTN